MKIVFPKDLVIVDFESSAKELEQAMPTQIGAILLDRETLGEKRSFVRVIDDQNQVAAAKDFVVEFGYDFLFASWAAEKDRALFRRLMLAAQINPHQFDYHVYDLWPVAYTYLLQRGYTGSVRSEEMFQAFGLPARDSHDALEDCRYEAEILRKIIHG